MCVCGMNFRTHQWVEEGVGEVWEGGGLGNMVRWAISLEWNFKGFQFSDATWCTNLQVWMKSHICLARYSYLQNAWPWAPRQNFLLTLVLLGCSEAVNKHTCTCWWTLDICCLSCCFPQCPAQCCCVPIYCSLWESGLGGVGQSNALVFFVRTNVLQSLEKHLCVIFNWI